ncbi:MAG: PHP domain-containing protein, partial [Cellulomonadaceae bacterium]
MAHGVTDDFVHLHVHSAYSLRDAPVRLTDLFDAVCAHGQGALALTDHDYLFGAYDFWSGAIMAGLRPIVGLDLTLAPDAFGAGTPPSGAGAGDTGAPGPARAPGADTVTLWARNDAGLRNLFRLSSAASRRNATDGVRGADLALLAEHHEGLIVATGGVHGVVPHRLGEGRWEEAVRATKLLREVFGADSCYVEGPPVDPATQRYLAEIAELTDTGLLATGDVHHLEPDGRLPRRTLAGATRARGLAPGAPCRIGDGLHLRSGRQMRTLWSDYPEACRNTTVVAEQCDVAFGVSTRFSAPARVPAGHDANSWLAECARRGLARRLPGAEPQVAERLEEELQAHRRNDESAYVLLVADLVQWAHTQGIGIGPGRGNAPASLVAFALGITDVDPVRFGLPFARFRNTERPAVIDIDLDVDADRRAELYDYLVATYGRDHVATFGGQGRTPASTVLRRVAELLGHPNDDAELLAQLVPEGSMLQPVRLESAIDPAGPMKEEAGALVAVYQMDSGARAAVDLAMSIDGMPDHWGATTVSVTATAVPMTDVVPVLWDAQRPDRAVTQLTKATCEGLGLPAFGLVPDRVVATTTAVAAGLDPDGRADRVLAAIPESDPTTFAFLAMGPRWVGRDVSPFRDMVDVMATLRPTTIADLAAAYAVSWPARRSQGWAAELARLKRGDAAPERWNPAVAEAVEFALAETYGMLVYQEQLTQVVAALGGLGLERADLLRRDMGRGAKEDMVARRTELSAAMARRGHTPDTFVQVWARLRRDAGLVFCKAHA